MKEKSKEEKDKGVKEMIELAAERLGNIILKCWWHSKRNKKSKKKKSN